MTTSSPSRETPNDDRGVQSYEVTIGIVTALPVEENAMEGLVDGLRRYRRSPDRNSYWLGAVPSSEPDQPHRVALVMLPRDGTQSAATCCANMLRTFPNIRTVIMTGIAGGIPRPEQSAKHVRLGDVVVAVDGIVPYGNVRQEGEATRLRQRQSAGLISSWFLGAARELQVMAEHGDRRWEHWLDARRSATASAFPRPPESTDVLYVRDRITSHPPRPNHGPPGGMPRVHYGVIGSADMLMVDEDFRDKLAREHPDMCAIEMEGVGIAASTAAFDRTWFMVRGVADYCERAGKNDVWHPYAAYAAASYVRALLETAPPAHSEQPPRESVQPRPLITDEDQDALDALLRRLPPDLDIWPIWHATVPDLWEPPSEVLSDPSVAYHFLARMNADASGLHPAILFVALLSREMDESDPGLAGQLRSWVDACTEAAGTSEALRARLRPGSGAGTAIPSVGPALLIEMDVVGIDRSRCRITPYLQGVTGPWRPRQVKVAEVDLDGIGQAVSDLVAEAEGIWAKGNASGQAEIEFLLPAGLLNLPVQWYPASPRLEFVQPICVRYPVVVRSVERMRAETVRLEWINRWNRLDRQPFTGDVYWGIRYQSRPTTTEAWAAGLSGDDRYVIVVLSDPPGTELGMRELRAALAAGVPVILWDQRLNRPIDDATDGLRRLILEPTRLPVEMRALRVEAERVAAEQPDHYGRSVALLWDNPNRVVSTGRADT